MRTIPSDPRKIIDGFSAYLLLEAGSADNSRQAYVRDASRLLEFLQNEGISPDAANVDTLHSFMVAMVDLGLAPRSLRRLVSGIRALFRYLVAENYLETNPALLLEPPRLGL
ncbi:MAG: site-specific integrase, partial [Muribaculaceae bacterium]|nr:site-specific integrase [Muribaculaceae bacterium]